MTNMRIYEYAKAKDMTSKEILEIAHNNGADFKSHMTSIDEQEQAQLDKWIKEVSSPASKPAGDQAKSTGKQNKGQDNNKSKPQAKEEKSQSNSGNQSRKQQKNNNNKNNKQNNNKKAKPAQNQGQVSQQSTNKQAQAGDQRNYQANEDRQTGGRRRRNRRGRNRKQNQNTNQGAGLTARKHRDLPETLVYTEGMNIQEIAKLIHRDATEIIMKLMGLGIMANQNQALSGDVIELIALEYGIEAEEKEVIDVSDLDVYFEEARQEDADKLQERPPVVTIMGHVDHGKTTLLDKLRNARIAEGEAGGITQHIGAYQVDVNGKPISFLDTPGHEAFTTMRARGADVTDIAIIVVAADDGVMPQTVEAINHAKAADVPIIIAVNKIDKPTANPDRVKQELMEYQIIPEEWGGDNIFVEISALQGINLDELLDMILLVAEVQELKANAEGRALGSVIEARLDKAQGSTATLLVQSGTLNVGDPIVVGNTFGRVRTMTNDQGRRIQKAGPSTPVEITGLNDAPQAGDLFVTFEDEKTARQVGETRATRAQEEQRASGNKVTLDNLFDTLQEGELRSVNVVLKGDVQGSVEALSASLQKIDVEGVKVDIVHKAVGAINESDISLAAASDAIVIGFNVRPTPQARAQADQEEIDIRTYRVIYDAIEEVEQAMKGMLDPEYEEQITGYAVVRETYTVSKLGTIAGSFVQDGVIERSNQARLLRDNIVIYDGELSSLRRFQDDVREVAKGYECGIMLENYNDIKIDDIIETYKMVEVERK